MKLRNLPSDLRKLAWQRALEQGCELKYDRARSWALSRLFIFDKTTEGHAFWAKFEYSNLQSTPEKILIKRVFTKVIQMLTAKDLGFICNELHELWKEGAISEQEYKFVLEYFGNQRPSEAQHTEFTQHPSWMGQHSWWRYDGLQQRILFS